MRPVVRRWWAVMLALGVMPLALEAQASDTTIGAAQSRPDGSSRFCLRGHPAPRCASFLLYELGYYRRLAGTMSERGPYPSDISQPELDDHVALEVGAMSNRGDHDAVGGTLLLGFSTGVAGSRLALKGRYRRWAKDGRGSVDVSAGVLRAEIPRQYPQSGAEAYGLTGDVALGYADLAAVTLRADAVRADGRTSASLYAGARLGSYPAAGATVVFAAAIALAIAVLSGTDL